MRDGVAWALDNETDIHIVGSGKLAEVSQVAAEHEPDLMIIGVNAPGGGLSVARKLASLHPNMSLLFLTISERQEDARAALEAGVRGYALKDVSGKDLVRTVRAVAAGETYITPDLAVRLLIMPTFNSAGRWSMVSRDLSKREQKILDGVALGMTNKEIAGQLALSERTIKYHMTGLMRKLNARNRVEAFLIVRHGSAHGPVAGAN